MYVSNRPIQRGEAVKYSRKSIEKIKKLHYASFYHSYSIRFKMVFKKLFLDKVLLTREIVLKVAPVSASICS